MGVEGEGTVLRCVWTKVLQHLGSAVLVVYGLGPRVARARLSTVS